MLDRRLDSLRPAANPLAVHLAFPLPVPPGIRTPRQNGVAASIQHLKLSASCAILLDVDPPLATVPSCVRKNPFALAFLADPDPTSGLKHSCFEDRQTVMRTLRRERASGPIESETGIGGEYHFDQTLRLPMQQ